MRLGLSSYTFVWGVGVPGYPSPQERLTVWTLLDRASTLGVNVLQIADNLPLHALSEGDLSRLRAEADRRGISLEVGTVGIDTNNLRRYLGIACRLGSPFLRTVIDTANDRPSPEEVVERLASMIPEFQAANIVLAFENHDRFKAATLRELVQRFGCANVGVCLDTANSLGCMEGPEFVVDTLAPWIVNLHIKDVCVFRPPHHKGFIVEGRPAGQGQLDIPGLLQRLKKQGVDPNAILELWPPPESEVNAAVVKESEWTRQSVAYLRQFIPD
jgi:sugar phosphate isomerase/epimerase